MGQFKAIRSEPAGIPHRRWINEVPNDGLIRYLNVFNEERLLITSPKALAEVLVTKNYDFDKPAMIRDTLARLLGIGVLLAEGEEHKVNDLVYQSVARAYLGADATQALDACFRLSPYQGPLSGFLGEGIRDGRSDYIQYTSSRCIGY